MSIFTYSDCRSTSSCSRMARKTERICKENDRFWNSNEREGKFKMLVFL